MSEQKDRVYRSLEKPTLLKSKHSKTSSTLYGDWGLIGGILKIEVSIVSHLMRDVELFDHIRSKLAIKILGEGFSLETKKSSHLLCYSPSTTRISSSLVLLTVNTFLTASRISLLSFHLRFRGINGLPPRNLRTEKETEKFLIWSRECLFI